MPETCRARGSTNRSQLGEAAASRELHGGIVQRGAGFDRQVFVGALKLPDDGMAISPELASKFVRGHTKAIQLGQLVQLG